MSTTATTTLAAAAAAAKNNEALKRLLSSLQNDPKDACNKCRRTAQDVMLEEHQSGCLPYGSCEACQQPRFERYSPTKKELAGKEMMHTVLTNLISEKNWDKAAQRLALYPREAEPVVSEEKRGDALHWEESSSLYFAIDYEAPMDFLRELAMSAPNLIHRVSFKYESFCSMDDCPEQYEYSHDKSPLQLSLTKAKHSDSALARVKFLLEAMCLQDSTHVSNISTKIITTLDQAWKQVKDGIQKCLEMENFPQGSALDVFRVIADGDEQSSSEMRRCWEALRLLYRAMYYKSLDGDQSVLAAIVGAPVIEECHPMLLRFALQLYPQDELAGPIIHCVARQVHRPPLPASVEDTDFHPRPAFLCDYEEVYYSDYQDKYKNFIMRFGDTNKEFEEENQHHEYCVGENLDPQDPLPEYKSSYMDLIVKARPEAAGWHDQDGAMLLHVAIAAGRSWMNGLESIVSAHPAALGHPISRGTWNDFYPFMIAAAVSHKKSSVDCQEHASDSNDDEGGSCFFCELRKVQLIYNLLRRFPAACTPSINYRLLVGGEEEPAKKKLRSKY